MKALNIVTPKLKYINNYLFFEEVNLRDVVDKFSTPVYVYSKNQIKENFSNYKNALKDRKHLICFAMKANSNREILKIVKSLGGGCDVTSGGELFRALNAGIPPEKIVYAGVGKSQQEIEYAIKNKILMFNVESQDEVELINKIAYKNKTDVNIAIRVNPEIKTHTISHISTGEEGTKFGIPINDVVDFAKHIKQNYKNLKLVGLHYHIGSQICVLEPFVSAAKKVSKLIDELSLVGIKIKFIDIGGGLGVRYKDENPPSVEKLISSVLKYLPKNLIVICEPGRSIVGNAGILITKILYHKKVKTKNFLIVDASMTDLIRPAFYGAYHNVVPLRYDRTNQYVEFKHYDVVGPVCETSDFLAKNRELPYLENGEYLVVETAGAYGFVMSSNYNSRMRSAEVMVDKNKFYLICQREDYKDLIDKEIK